MTRKNLISGLAWITLTILCWAPLFSVAKRTLPYVDAFAMGTLRYVSGVVLFVALLVALEGRQALRYEGRVLPAAVFGLIGITGFNLLVWIGLMFTQPEHAAIINALQPPLAALAVWVQRGQRPAAFTLGCVTLAIAGVLLVILRGNPFGALESGMLLGDLMIFGAAVSWVVYGLAASYFPGWSPLRVSVLTCIPGFAGLFAANLIALALGWASVPSLAAVAGLAWQIAYLAVCTVVLGVLGFNNATRKLGPLNAMLMLNAIPVMVFGIEAALGRSFTAVELIGALVVVAALVANNLYLRGASTSR